MALVRVQSVAPLDQAVRDGIRIEPALVKAVYERMQDYIGREFDGANTHTEWLAVTLEGSRRAVSVVFFVDTDGTLNVASIEPGV